jgi:hypothetical protein
MPTPSAVTGHGASFTFVSDRGTFSGKVTRLGVDTPAAETADMTAWDADASFVVLVPTGGWKGGTISVDFLASTSTTDVQSLVRGVGSLSFSSPGYSVSRQVLLESASVDVSIGSAVKGALRFSMTDYYP